MPSTASQSWILGAMGLIVIEGFFQIHYLVKGWQGTNLIFLFLLICLGCPKMKQLKFVLSELLCELFELTSRCFCMITNQYASIRNTTHLGGITDFHSGRLNAFSGH